MPTNISNYISNQLPSQTTAHYTTDYVGSVQLLENSGFSPFTTSSPLTSTLNQIFDRFVQKTGLDTTSNKLVDEFLSENPSTRSALGLYTALENTFSARNPGDQAAIVDFLNTKLDEYITTSDTNGDSTLNLDESGMEEMLFNQMDSNNDYEISTDELKTNFFSSFNELDNVLNYFQSNRGVLIDVYG